MPPVELPPEQQAWNTSVLESLRLVQVVREYDKPQISQIISHLREEGLVEGVLVALAALVDVDQPTSSLLSWIDEAELDRKVRRPWERDEYPPCAAELDHSPTNTGSRHGSPSRHTAGCRGEGCILARKDYDAWVWPQRKARRAAQER